MSDHRPAHPTAPAVEAPQTLEGWYVLHDGYTIDWPTWRTRPLSERQAALAELEAWLAVSGEGDSAVFGVVGQKTELLFIHYRPAVGDLRAVERGLRQTALYRDLRPSGAFLSVIEVSLYEATAQARGALARRGQTPESPGYAEALAAEIAKARAGLEARLRRPVPAQRHVCWYPMSKRRQGSDNWYTLATDERRVMMRSHGQVGHAFAEQVTQVVSGAIGLDDWEWGVDLHADDPLVFKKLVTAMRYDQASARFAEFGPFMIGERLDAAALRVALGIP